MPRSDGQCLYESDLVAHPLYHDGTPRKAWHELDALARSSWERPLLEDVWEAGAFERAVDEGR